MTDLEELALAADNLCATLDKIAENEKKFCHDVQFWLDKYNMQTKKLARDLEEIRLRFGG